MLLLPASFIKLVIPAKRPGEAQRNLTNDDYYD